MTRAQTKTGKGSISRRQARRRQGSQWLWIGLAALLVILIGVALVLAGQGAFVPDKSVEFPIQSRDHIFAGATHPAYNSDPPTGGWHYPEPARAAVYDQALPDEQLIHNLEHGHIVIYYDCSKLANCDAVKPQLKAIFDKYNGWKVVVAPRQNRDADAAIAVTAWGRLDKMPAFDQRRIEAFIDRYRDKGPEQTLE